MVFAIVACEIGFWVLLFAGLVTRYLFRIPRLSTVLLLGVPLLDLVLLALITWDLMVHGSTATLFHGLGAVYLGFSVVQGPSLIRRVDAWFAHRFAGAAPPVKVPRKGIERVREEWRSWFRWLGAAALASVVLGAMILLVNDFSRTEELSSWFLRLGLVTVAWLLGWPVWETVAYYGAGPQERSHMNRTGERSTLK